MNDALKLSKRGADLIKAFESCERRTPDGRFRAYRCPAGVLTIGWGHTNAQGRNFGEDAVWSQAECDDAFLEDMEHYARAVRRLVKRPLEQHQFDALLSFTYNCGERNLAASTLLKKLNGGDADGAALEFHRWNKAGGRVLRGLVRRRASEALLFQGIPDLDFDGRPDSMPRSVERPRVRTAAQAADAARAAR